MYWWACFKFDALPAELKEIVRLASQAASADMAWKAMHRMSQDFAELQAMPKLKIYRTPRPILDAQLKAWNAVIDKRSGENPLFAKVVESQKAWAKRVVHWNNAVQVDQRASFAHYFGAKPA